MLEKMKMIWQDAKQLKDERGLTLVELLVVVVILGIIAAIAVVAIGGIIENSKKDAMVADAKQMVSSAKLYTASNPKAATLNFASGGNGEQYISQLKDPFGDTAYKVSTVVITEDTATKGKFNYAVNLEGTKYKFTSVNEGSINKEAANLVPVEVK